jgi:excisionase family DNA binding protein
MNRLLQSEVMNLAEAAAYLRLTPEIVKRLAAQGAIPGRKVGRQWRFWKDALNAWLAGRDALDSRAELLRQAGAFKNDETLAAIRAAAYAARGRPEIEAKD